VVWGRALPNFSLSGCLDLHQTEQIRVGAHEAVCLSSESVLEELVVRWIATSVHGNRGSDELAAAPQERHQRSGLDRVEAKLLKQLWASQDIFDLGEDGVSEQQMNRSSRQAS
jgi:hypothetical protein